MGAKFILLVIAVVCFVARAFGAAVDRLDLGWLGLACFAAAFLVP